MTNRRELGAAIGGCAAALLAAALVVPALAQREAQDWPQWRGPTRDSIIRPAQPWPADLSGLERVWRVELGPGYGGPIVSGGRVFVTETRDRRGGGGGGVGRSSGGGLGGARWPGGGSGPC